MHTRKRLLACAAMAAALAACAGGDEENPFASLRSDDVIFLSQSAPANEVMQALFQGRVSVDSVGCVRLNGPDQHTVIWPYGFTLETRGAELYVRAPDGREVGRLGGEFRFGGGEIPSLHPGIALSGNGRERAASSCPSRFWIVGEVP